MVWGAFGVVALTGIGVALGRVRTTAAESADAAAEVVRVARRDIHTDVKATGVVKPMTGAEVRVGSRISGVVKRLYVQIGDSVRKGQLLAELDDRDLIARRDEAAATLQQLEASRDYLAAELRRVSALATARVATPSELDAARRAASVAARQVDAARASLDFAVAQVEYARIVAPIAGVVSSVATQEGETVAASFAAPTFLTLLDPSRLEVWAYVDETDIGRIRAGQSARFTVDTYGDHEFEGRVVAVHPSAEIRDNVVDYVTVVRFAPPRDRVLRPEMTATVRIALQSRPKVLALPARAIGWSGARPYVLVRSARGAERRWITTGSRDESWVEIVDGLRDGEEVLVGGATATEGGES